MEFLPISLWQIRMHLASRLLTNDSMSNYHSLQVEVRRRFSDGLQFQADYTFSKALTDAPDAQGNNQNTLENFRTFRDKRLDYRRSNDDQTHRFVANGIYDLPFGNGRRWLSGSNGVRQSSDWRLVGRWHRCLVHTATVLHYLGSYQL